MSCEVDSVLQPLRTPERRRSARWEPDAAEAGALSLQDFQVLGVLGVGTYGVVKLARHRASGACVALKVLSKEQVVMLRQEKHILRERRVHATLRHPFVARLYGAFQDRDCLYLVLEYLPGGELYSVVYAVDDGPLPSPKRQCVRSNKEEEVRPMSPVHTPRKLRRGSTDSSALVIDASGRAALRDVMTGALREEHAAFYLGCVLLALEHLHGQALLYRDLKLENLVIDACGYPKMLDFGFAKRDDGRSSTMCGSAEYMAPEVLLHQPHDRRVDLWAFGVLAFEMLTGRTPFYHENARELGRRVVNDPVEFPVGFQDDHPLAADLIAKLLVKAPEDRVKDAKELKQHAFFATYFPSTKAWDNLLQRRHAPPFVPKLSGPFDASFFRTLDERELQALDDDVLPFDGDDGGVFAEF